MGWILLKCAHQIQCVIPESCTGLFPIQVLIKKVADRYTELKRWSYYIDCSLFADTHKCCPCFASKCPPREIAAENLLYLAVTLMLFKLIILNSEAVLDVSPKLCLGWLQGTLTIDHTLLTLSIKHIKLGSRKDCVSEFQSIDFGYCVKLIKWPNRICFR